MSDLKPLVQKLEDGTATEGEVQQLLASLQNSLENINAIADTVLEDKNL